MYTFDTVISFLRENSHQLGWPRADKEMKSASITAATLLLLYTTYKMTSSINDPFNVKRGTKNIPVPDSAYPYIGHLLSLGSVPSQTIQRWHEKYGPIIRLRMGVKDWITISDPAMAHKVFVTHGASTSYRPHSTYVHNHFNSNGRGIVFAQPGAGLKENRAAVLHILAPKQVEQYGQLMEKEADALLDRLIKQSEKTGFFDPTIHFDLTAYNIISMIGFQKKFGSIEDKDFLDLQQMNKVNNNLLSYENDISMFLPLLSFLDYVDGKERRMRNHVNKVHRPLMNKLISHAWSTDKSNFSKSLKDANPDLTVDDVMNLMSDVLGAGTDTVTSTLQWTIAILCHHPDIQHKMREELDRFRTENNRYPRFDEHDDTPYTFSVIREVLRVQAPTTLGLPHQTGKDVEVDGYFIPSGTTILTSMNALHGNSHLYDEPQKFKPERYLNKSGSMTTAANGKLEDRDHFAFGWGRRICPGISMAESQLYNAIVRIYAGSTVESEEKLPDIVSMENAGLTMRPKKYKVKFVRRQAVPVECPV
ncbi:cytochrome P450 [Pilobolus umbonatus]|nr:cytochrome P450 [Pilobolus umbonatus]